MTRWIKLIKNKNRQILMMLYRFITLCALLGINNAKPLYDQNLSDVVNYSQLNFDKQVSKKRDKGISVVHFYKASGKYIYSTI